MSHDQETSSGIDWPDEEMPIVGGHWHGDPQSLVFSSEIVDIETQHHPDLAAELERFLGDCLKEEIQKEIELEDAEIIEKLSQLARTLEYTPELEADIPLDRPRDIKMESVHIGIKDVPRKQVVESGCYYVPYLPKVEFVGVIRDWFKPRKAAPKIEFKREFTDTSTINPIASPTRRIKARTFP